MKRRAILFAIIILASVAWAQQMPKIEVFGGYQYISFDNKQSIPFLNVGSRQSLNGFDADIAYKPVEHLGLVADFGAGYKTFSVIDFLPSLANVKLRFYPILFGPRISAGSGKARPFAEALFGLGHISIGASALGASTSQSFDKFTMAFGGGLDVKVRENVSIRVVKFDYMIVRFSESVAGVSLTENLNNLRAATGVVFTF